MSYRANRQKKTRDENNTVRTVNNQPIETDCYADVIASPSPELIHD